MIRTILFDIGNVLVPFDFKRGYTGLAARCRCAAEQIPARIRATGLVPRFETGQVEARQFVEQLSAALELDIGYEEFCELWSSIFLPGGLIPEDLIEGLRGRYRLLVLSNTNSIHFPMVQANYPVLRHFDGFVLSYEVGAAKPSPEIFDAAIAKAECGADECFFTDDLAINVDAAREQGMDAVQFQSAGQIEAELRKRGLLL